MSEQRASSVWRNGMLIAILMFLCAFVSIVLIQLLVIPFFESGNQPKPVAGAPPIAQATATIDYEQGPPPPPPPTGTVIWSLPTPDPLQLENAPVAPLPPDHPTPELIIEPETTPLVFPPVNAVPPSGEYKTYTDPVLGFSFEYPDNWHLLQSPSSELRNGKGFVITIQNYDIVDQKGDKTSEQLKIEFAVTAQDQFSSLEEWIDSSRKSIQAASDPGYSLTSIERMEIAGVPAVRWTLTAPMSPQGAVVVGFRKDERTYILWTYPATSKYIASLDEIVSSIKFP